MCCRTSRAHVYQAVLYTPALHCPDLNLQTLLRALSCRSFVLAAFAICSTSATLTALVRAISTTRCPVSRRRYLICLISKRC